MCTTTTTTTPTATNSHSFLFLAMYTLEKLVYIIKNLFWSGRFRKSNWKLKRANTRCGNDDWVDCKLNDIIFCVAFVAVIPLNGRACVLVSGPTGAPRKTKFNWWQTRVDFRHRQQYIYNDNNANEMKFFYLHSTAGKKNLLPTHYELLNRCEWRKSSGVEFIIFIFFFGSRKKPNPFVIVPRCMHNDHEYFVMPEKHTHKQHKRDEPIPSFLTVCHTHVIS